MNQEPTKEQQDIIEKAAKEYDNRFQPPIEHFTEMRIKTFRTAVTFALSSPDLMRGVLEEFAEWVRTFEALERQNGQWAIESQLSDRQVVKAFIEDIKQKDNVDTMHKL